MFTFALIVWTYMLVTCGTTLTHATAFSSSNLCASERATSIEGVVTYKSENSVIGIVFEVNDRVKAGQKGNWEDLAKVINGKRYDNFKICIYFFFGFAVLEVEALDFEEDPAAFD